MSKYNGGVLPPGDPKHVKKCQNCAYRCGEKKFKYCNYLSIVGHSRGCPPGIYCTKYKKGKPKEEKPEVETP